MVIVLADKFIGTDSRLKAIESSIRTKKQIYTELCWERYCCIGANLPCNLIVSLKEVFVLIRLVPKRIFVFISTDDFVLKNYISPSLGDLLYQLEHQRPERWHKHGSDRNRVIGVPLKLTNVSMPRLSNVIRICNLDYMSMRTSKSGR